MAPVVITEEAVGPPSPNAIRVLVTGFGPFWRYAVNPSWLAVKPLHNTILRVEPSTDPVFVQSPQTLPTQTPQNPVKPPELEDVDHMPVDEDAMPSSLDIHITALQIPVTYQAVMAASPGLHSVPPVLPESLDGDIIVPNPPANGYDFVFHIGVAGRGPLRIEQIAHKSGYRMKDADGLYAPVVQRDQPAIDMAQAAEAERAAGIRQQDIVPVTDIGPPTPNDLPPGVNGENAEPPHAAEVVEHPVARGFSLGYEQFADELPTEIDVASLIHSMKESGHTQVYSSMDAGHYLCDFLFYGSLAEAKRVAEGRVKDKLRSTPPRATPVLFMHCPPDGQPLKTEAVTSAIKFIVAWVCRSTRP